MDVDAVLSRRRRVAAAYTAAGFVLAAAVLAVGTAGLPDGMPIGPALAFIGIIIVFAWFGGAVAGEITSLETSWRPQHHLKAVARSLPLGLMAIALTVVVCWDILQSGQGSFVFIPPVAFVLWIRSRIARLPPA
ncbi:MAG: hypothetical protein P4L82_16215 [Ancalomicrobiaceae bacterium]|nr:hypothetical protein [Ancalomicrobiaceae bacterium]